MPHSLSFLLPIGSFLCLMILMLQHKHFLMALLLLETFILSMTLTLPLTMSLFSTMNSIMAIILLTLGACEASLGLALLVLMARAFGNDRIQSIPKNLC